MRLVRYTYPFRSLSMAQNDASRSPWSGLESEMDRMFQTALTNLGDTAATRHFPIDLYEDKNNTYVRAELPGVNREDINVEMVEGYLTLSAIRKPAPGEGSEGESSFSFSRSVAINEAVQADKVSAAYENGTLTVTLPKREEAKAKKISVTVK